MEKLKTNELSLGLNQTLRNDLVDNFDKIQQGVDGQADSLNKQILDMLGNVTPQDQNEVTQARIDGNGKAYDTLKGREDATQATAETALSEERDTSVEVQDARTNSSSKTYPTLKERMDNQENDLNNIINAKLSEISVIPETFTSLTDLQSKYPTGKSGIFVVVDTGHKYIWSNGSWIDSGAYQSSGISKNSITFDKLEDNIRKRIFQGISTPSLTYARGLFNSNFSVTDTASWSFFLYRVKKDDYFKINTISDRTQPTVLSFDEKLNLISSQNSLSIDKYVVPEDGYLAVNLYMDLGKKTGIDQKTVKISGVANGKFNRKSLIADESTLNFPGYINITSGTIDSAITPKDGYATTDFISVVPNSYVLINAMIGTGSGVVGYDDNKNAVSILSKSVNGNEYSDNKFISIPSNVSFIRVSTDTTVPFAVFETKVSKKDYATQGGEINVNVSPIGAYNGIDKINSAYPNGTDGIVLNTVDGYWYYWQDGSWKKGSAYPISEKDNSLNDVMGVNFPSGSPLEYKYYRQFGRRDFYNDNDSFGIYKSDFSTDVFKSPSNVNNVTGALNFVVSQSNGKLIFNNPQANGITAVQVHGYFPFSTSRLEIDTIAGNANGGIIFGELSLENYLSVKATSNTIECSLVLSNNIVKNVQFNLDSPNGKTLQVQNTGRALIVFVNSGDSFTELGRFDFGANFDARKEKYVDTWKTFVFSSTDSHSSEDSVSIRGFDTGIRSGANSVSIRFLTYEDGTFIQKGNYMYFLVEGTGQTISDLFTQIVKINFKTYEVQSIGAIFESRSDGTDDGILLGDDSIKVVYDRYDQTWKGISCGMEYADYGSPADRPKLYFETKQNLLEGGIIIVRNATQIKDILNKNIGTSQTTYSEDFDFYYDANDSLWHITGNMVSGGYMTYTSPNLKDNYEVKSTITNVPTGVRDTGNQFVNFAGVKYITTGGTTNNLGLRKFDGTYLGSLNLDVPLSENTNGPWCTIVPFLDGDKIQIFLLSFDRLDLLQGKYDHGGLYCWKASKN